jgi:hypothetical protein
VEEWTGYPTNESSFIDESRAAALAIPARGQAAVVMDMGGGTTDVGIFEWRKDALHPLRVDSLDYGGNAFLRLLVDQPELFPNPSLPRNRDERMLWLTREVRLAGFAEVVRKYYNADASARQRSVELLLRFFDPLVYFVRRLFDSLVEGNGRRAEPVTVYLMGNGWLLADAVPLVDGAYGSTYGEVLRTLLEKRGFEAPEILVRPEGLDDWPGPKSAVALGVLKADARQLFAAPEEADGMGVRSIVGFDLEIDDGADGRTGVPWNEPIPLTLGSRACAPLLGGVALPRGWEFLRYEKGAQVRALEEVCRKDIAALEPARLGRSPLARFIETVYLPQLGPAGGRRK